jgi:hypothetical protein
VVGLLPFGSCPLRGPYTVHYNLSVLGEKRPSSEREYVERERREGEEEKEKLLWTSCYAALTIWTCLWLLCY